VPDDVVEGVRVLGGSHVAPYDETLPRTGDTPVLWLGRHPERSARSLWLALAERFPTTGLWPLLLGSLDDDGERPWRSGDLLEPPQDSAHSPDAMSVLASSWSHLVEDDDDEEIARRFAPFGREFPGLAPPSDGAEAPAALEATVDAILEAGTPVSLGLVSVTRPADVLSALRWSGAVNQLQPVHLLTSLLRSWEDRFGTLVAGVGFDTLTLAVTRPPKSMRVARALAVELIAACPDLVLGGDDTLETFAASIQHGRTWSFWWD
jgi:hypothetical protein